MAYAYAKPPVYYYQTIDRKNLQFTKYPLYSVHTPEPPPPPPDPAIEHDGQATDEQHGDVGHDDVGKVGEGNSGRRSKSPAG